MSTVKIYSNYVRKANATIMDSDSRQDEILLIVKQALESGVKEIYFNYKEEGLDESNPIVNTGETHTG